MKRAEIFPAKHFHFYIFTFLHWLTNPPEVKKQTKHKQEVQGCILYMAYLKPRKDPSFKNFPFSQMDD